MTDIISRKAAIKAIGNLYPDMPKIEFLDNRSLWRQKYEQYINAQQTIRDLPSVPVNYGSTNLIDRQAAIEAVGVNTWAGSRISSLPTVDAVHVVRCKDCKWYKTNYSWNGTEHKVCVIEPYEPVRKECDFCSNAERREDAEVH